MQGNEPNERRWLSPEGGVQAAIDAQLADGMIQKFFSSPVLETSGSFGPDYVHNGGRPTSSHVNQKEKNIFSKPVRALSKGGCCRLRDNLVCRQPNL